ncbi:MAG: hypothetical protein E7577_07875 [Ruminococcaceae bacterium]|nr:hypothetical protein [Oscillospiraceae bacterium]
MKCWRKYKRWLIICVAVMLFIATTLGGIEVSANSSDDIIKDGLNSASDAVASHGESELADGMRGESIEELGENLTTLLSSEKIFEEITAVLRNALPDAIKLLAALMGLLLICAAARGLSSGMDGEKTATAFSFLSTAAISAALMGAQYGEIARAREFFGDISALMDAMIPVTGAVWAMGGNVSSAGVGTATLYVMLAAVQKLVAGAVVPVCALLAASAACSSLGGGGIVGGFGSAVKKCYTFFIGLIMTVFVFVLGAQTTVAGAADTAAARSGKLIASTVIPVVGGAVGETLRTVAGSVTYIKSVVGIGGIVLIFILTLPTLTSLLLSRLVYLIVASVADALGCHSESRLLGELGNVYGFLIGAVAVTAIAFTIALALFLRCTVAVG